MCPVNFQANFCVSGIKANFNRGQTGSVSTFSRRDKKIFDFANRRIVTNLGSGFLVSTRDRKTFSDAILRSNLLLLFEIGV